MIDVEFTQFLRPHGKRMTIVTEVDDGLKDQVAVILDNGFRFEIEDLTTGEVHMTISDQHADYYSRVCANGPAVPINVEALIKGFDLGYALELRSMLADEDETT